MTIKGWPMGAWSLAALAGQQRWESDEPGARLKKNLMVLHLRSGVTLSGEITRVDGCGAGQPTLVVIDDKKLVPWCQIDWFELAENE